MKPYVLGLCGGSGSGKSTLAFGLADRYPGKVTVFQLDDYFRQREEVPMLHGFANYDDPLALYSERMIADLATLISGKPVTINTKSPRLNPDYVKTRKRIPAIFRPNKLIVVEGFLTLYFEGLRKQFDYSIYLDVPFDVSTDRRAGEKINNYSPEYFGHVLKPMSERYVYPNKKYANRIVKVDDKSKHYTLGEVDEILNSQKVF
jgi:uridine kinase